MSFKGYSGIFLVIALGHSLLASLFAAPPDLTQGGKPDKQYQWNLGATGAKGWFWNKFVGGGTDSSLTRQILITEVAAGSPADGKLEKGDVILGVNDQNFTGDARKLFVQAVTAAEQDSNQGILKLVRWREGKTENVELKLEVMGSYTSTAPYDCPKSKKIFEQGCAAIAKRGFKNADGVIQINIENDMNGLALLASGQQDYLPMISEYALAVAECKIDPEGLPSWEYGFNTLFLAEYVLATQDNKALPGLKRLSLEIANGISGVGTWGHGLAKPNGNLKGYGCMNIVGIPLAMSLILAREAGVKDPALDKAISKSSTFLRQWVNIGAIPYGDHEAWPGHEDNGKCSGAAILFDILGDHEAAKFYSRCGTAAYSEKEGGHCGNFFNMMWALPGVSRCGPQATATFFKEASWYFEMARTWDGRCEYLGYPGEDSYVGWDCTGSYLLGYALPMKSLYITGRKPSCITPLSPDELAATIHAGRDFNYVAADRNEWYPQRSVDELLAGLSSWSPAERYRSARALRQREGDFLPQLTKLLDSSNMNSHYGACVALAMLGTKSDPLAPRVYELLKDKDVYTRILAARALPYMGAEVRKASVTHLLQAALIKSPEDPRQRFILEVSKCLFSCSPGTDEPKPILTESLNGVDRTLLYPTIKQALAHEDGLVRGLVANIYPLLTEADVKVLLPEIITATKKNAPSGEMFRMDVRWNGLKLLAKFKIREGMDLCVDMMSEFDWGCESQQCLTSLKEYGSAAKAMQPRLQQTILAIQKAIEKEPWNGERWNKDIAAIKNLMQEVKKDTTKVKLQTAKEFMAGK